MIKKIVDGFLGLIVAAVVIFGIIPVFAGYFLSLIPLWVWIVTGVFVALLVAGVILLFVRRKPKGGTTHHHHHYH